MLKNTGKSWKGGSWKRRHLLEKPYIKPPKRYCCFSSSVSHKPSPLLFLSSSLRLCLGREAHRFLTDKMCPHLKDTNLTDRPFQQRDVSRTKVPFKRAGWRLYLTQKGNEEREDGGGGREDGTTRVVSFINRRGRERGLHRC